MNTQSGERIDDGRLLLASDAEWFTAALQSVLRRRLPTMEIDVALGRDELLASTLRHPPNLVIVDQRLAPAEGVGALCRQLVDRVLGRRAPLLVYTSGGPEPELEAEALAGGAWGLLHEPLRSEVLTAKVARFLEVEASIAGRHAGACIDPETGLFTLPCMLDTIPVLASLARRRRAAVSCAVVGPTTPLLGASADEERKRTARLCAENVRASDLSGRVDGGDVAIVTFDAAAPEAETLVRRLNALIRQKRQKEEGYALSAGIVEIASGGEAEDAGDQAGRDREGPRSAADLEPGDAVATARSALEEAREAGGGIRVAAVA